MSTDDRFPSRSSQATPTVHDVTTASANKMTVSSVAITTEAVKPTPNSVVNIGKPRFIMHHRCRKLGAEEELGPLAFFKAGAWLAWPSHFYITYCHANIVTDNFILRY